jgi:PleD family two-component response regulator
MGQPDRPSDASLDVLIADDDAVSRGLLELTLAQWGYRVRTCVDGEEAMAALTLAEGPRLAVLDWMMPGLKGIDVCRRMRAMPDGESTYLILLTAKQELQAIVEGLESGANDFVSKPFRPAELRARLEVGRRMLRLQGHLAQRVAELESALAHVDQLQGLLPICSYCHRIRDDANYWQRLEAYIGARSQARFSHGICPTCFEQHVKPQLESLE